MASVPNSPVISAPKTMECRLSQSSAGAVLIMAAKTDIKKMSPIMLQPTQLHLTAVDCTHFRQVLLLNYLLVNCHTTHTQFFSLGLASFQILYWIKEGKMKSHCLAGRVNSSLHTSYGLCKHVVFQRTTVTDGTASCHMCLQYSNIINHNSAIT